MSATPEIAPDAPPLAPAEFEAAEPGRGRTADAPWRIPPRGWKDIAWRTWRETNRARLPAMAGGVTFYLLLATFPAIAALVSLIGLFFDVDTVERQFLHLSEMFPSEAIDFLGDEMVSLAAQEHGTLGAAFAVSALVSLWSARAGVQALFDAVNVAYNEVETRHWLLHVMITYAATLVAVAFIIGAAGVALAVPDVLHVLGVHHIVGWWAPMRWLGVLVAAVAAFTLVYRFGPSRRPARWRWLIVGGVFAAVAWMAGSFGFSWYLDTFKHLGVTYGSLGAMIGFMLWMWFSVIVVLLGAELNSEIEHQTACDTTVGGPSPLGARGAAMADRVGAAFRLSFADMWKVVADDVTGVKRAVAHALQGLADGARRKR
ncbi:MAG: YihY/virulence factor BrkB family protein [Caulobacteraceae bacterium]|jgi:membrane protein